MGYAMELLRPWYNNKKPEVFPSGFFMPDMLLNILYKLFA
jgi:hypothetical protein